MDLFLENRWGLCPFSEEGAGSLSNTVACAEAYLHTKWHLSAFSRFGHNGHWPKIVEVWQTSNLRRLRLGEEKRKKIEETTG